MRIVTVDAGSGTGAQRRLFEDFVAVQATSTAFGRRGPSTAWSMEEMRAMRGAGARVAYADRAAVDADAVIGMLAVGLPQHDNTDTALVMIHVAPGHRRAGVGAALLAEAERVARRHGRHILQAATEFDEDSADRGEDFARRGGFALAQSVVASHLSLPADRELMGRFVSGTGGAAAYELDLAWDRLPASWLADRAMLSVRMSTDAPHGDLRRSPEDWTPGRVREDAERVLRAGRRLLEVVARERRGDRLVGFTRITVPAQDPRTGYQQDTLVLREARGHGLGLRMKAAATLAVMDELPATRRIATWNAAANAPMLAVNRALGYRTDGVRREWQRILADAT